MTKETKDLNLEENVINSINTFESEKVTKTTSATSRARSTTNKKNITTRKTSASRSRRNDVTTGKIKTSNNKSAKKNIKTSSKKSPTRTIKKSTVPKTSKKSVEVEYYDLPYNYNQTVVKVLAQTPNTLFIYWEISDYDRENYKRNYGDNFFENTKPVLKIYNDTLNYSFEVDINDFANSWYLHVNDSKCEYRVELGRRPVYNPNVSSPLLKENQYVYISSSNKIDSPNDKILFNPSQKMIYFKNVKTNEKQSKDITSFSFIQNLGKFNNIYELPELYQKIYHEFYKNIYPEQSVSNNRLEINNPSSGGFSSRFK